MLRKLLDQLASLARWWWCSPCSSYSEACKDGIRKILRKVKTGRFVELNKREEDMNCKTVLGRHERTVNNVLLQDLANHQRTASSWIASQAVGEYFWGYSFRRQLRNDRHAPQAKPENAIDCLISHCQVTRLVSAAPAIFFPNEIIGFYSDLRLVEYRKSCSLIRDESSPECDLGWRVCYWISAVQDHIEVQVISDIVTQSSAPITILEGVATEIFLFKAHGCWSWKLGSAHRVETGDSFGSWRARGIVKAKLNLPNSIR